MFKTIIASVAGKSYSVFLRLMVRLDCVVKCPVDKSRCCRVQFHGPLGSLLGGMLLILLSMTIVGCSKRVYSVSPVACAVGSGVNRIRTQVESRAQIGAMVPVWGDDFVIDAATLQARRVSPLELIGLCDSRYRHYRSDSDFRYSGDGDSWLRVFRFESEDDYEVVFDMGCKGWIDAIGALESAGEVRLGVVVGRLSGESSGVYLCEGQGSVYCRFPLPVAVDSTKEIVGLSFSVANVCLVAMSFGTDVELDERGAFTTFVGDLSTRAWTAQLQGNFRVIDREGTLFGKLRTGEYRLVRTSGKELEFDPRGREYHALDGGHAFWSWSEGEQQIKVLKYSEMPWE